MEIGRGKEVYNSLFQKRFQLLVITVFVEFSTYFEEVAQVDVALPVVVEELAVACLLAQTLPERTQCLGYPVVERARRGLDAFNIYLEVLEKRLLALLAKVYVA